ncbi:nitroreductase family protein [Aeromicrobium sp. Sec7.5]|uniref:nitroreductase family protein n=1 Tax=Aeromicrobium sp. Sec7.5 TaxID=3121276 RepID=UPI002FE4AB0D
MTEPDALPTHPFALERYSPIRFDPDHVMSQTDVETLLDAARRSPSAGNSQPWAFVVGRRGDAVHRRLVPHLARSSARWAPDASAIVANLSHRLVEDSDLEYSEFSHYDVGQAVAHLTFQAHGLGLFVHQFRAFDREAVTVEFSVPRHWEVLTLAAIGVPHAEAAGSTGAGTSRDRRTVDEVTWARDL